VKVFSRKKSADDQPDPDRAVDPAAAEIVVLGYDLMVLWWQRRIVVQRSKGWQIYLEIGSEACVRADWTTTVFDEGSECLLSLRLRVGQPGPPSELGGSLEIAFPRNQEAAVQSLVTRVNAEISTRRNAERAAQPAAAPVSTPAMTTIQPAEPRPVYAEPEKPRHAAKAAQPVNPLMSTVVALADGRTTPAAEPPRPALPPPAPVEPREPPPRNEPPRLRQLDFTQAPDDENWISFCPLRTADEVRAPQPIREHG
jgi:hypothetical protein